MVNANVDEKNYSASHLIYLLYDEYKPTVSSRLA